MIQVTREDARGKTVRTTKDKAAQLTPTETKNKQSPPLQRNNVFVKNIKPPLSTNSPSLHLKQKDDNRGNIVI
jgi:hypothetical protein